MTVAMNHHRPGLFRRHARSPATPDAPDSFPARTIPFRHPRPENTRPFPALRPGETRPPERAKESSVQENGVNGGHRREASEKRVNPGTFPCRLDMELCACGAKRWVDLQGKPATPWQFINCGPRRGDRRAPRRYYEPLPGPRWTGCSPAGAADNRCPWTTIKAIRMPATPASRAPASAGVPRRGCMRTMQRNCSSARYCKQS